MLTEYELNNLENGYYFNNKYLIASGFGGSVYKINNKYVVKKLCSSWKYFKNEFKTTIILSNYCLSPKVIYHSKKNDKFRFFVMEKLDYTLYYMLKNKIFLDFHLGKLKNILHKLNKTKYIHMDLHFNNIMWSNYYNDFRIIDWEQYYITNNYNKNQYTRLINKSIYLMNNEFKVYKCFGFKIFKLRCLN